MAKISNLHLLKMRNLTNFDSACLCYCPSRTNKLCSPKSKCMFIYLLMFFSLLFAHLFLVNSSIFRSYLVEINLKNKFEKVKSIFRMSISPYNTIEDIRLTHRRVTHICGVSLNYNFSNDAFIWYKFQKQSDWKNLKI